MDKTNVKIRKVKNTDTYYLYKLLSERSSKVNISHKTMPRYNYGKQWLEIHGMKIL